MSSANTVVSLKPEPSVLQQQALAARRTVEEYDRAGRYEDAVAACDGRQSRSIRAEMNLGRKATF